MYPYAPGPYGQRPDANMMAAYHQRQQQHFMHHHQQRQQQLQHQQHGGGGHWNSNNNNGMPHSMDSGSAMQGGGYHNYMAPHYTPQMGYPMQHHQHFQQQQQYYQGGQFNGQANRQMEDGSADAMQPQIPGWAESRPGRTPCKTDWWSHVKEEMQFIDSPKGIDLEKEDEHANVMDELIRTGTTSGVVNDGDDIAAAFDGEGGMGDGDAAAHSPAFGYDAAAGEDEALAAEGEGDYDRLMEQPYTPTTPTLPLARGGEEGEEEEVSPSAVAAAAAEEGGAGTVSAHKKHPRRPSGDHGRRHSPSKKTGGEEAGRSPRGGKSRRTSQPDASHNRHHRNSNSNNENDNDDGKNREKGHKSKAHARHAAKNAGDNDNNNHQKGDRERRPSSPQESAALGNSLFLPPPPSKNTNKAAAKTTTPTTGFLVPATAPASAKAPDLGLASLRPAPTVEKAGGAPTDPSGQPPVRKAMPPPLTGMSPQPPNGFPGVTASSDSAQLHVQHLQPLPSIAASKRPSYDDNAGSLRLEYSVMPDNRRKVSEHDKSAATAEGKGGGATQADKDTMERVRDHLRARLSSSALDAAEMAKLFGGDKNAVAAAAVVGETGGTATAPPGQQPRRVRQSYSYMGDRRLTTLDEAEENDADERDSSVAYGSRSGSGDDDDEEEDDDDSSSGSGSSDSGSDGSGSTDDEVDYSTLHHVPDHDNYPGRSMLEYSAFRDVSQTGLRTEEDGRADSLADGGRTPPRSAAHGRSGEPRRSMGGYGLESFSVQESAALLHTQRHRPSIPTGSTTLPWNAAVGEENRDYMMVDMSVAERAMNVPTQKDEAEVGADTAVDERAPRQGAAKPAQPKVVPKTATSTTLATTATSATSPAPATATDTKPLPSNEAATVSGGKAVASAAAPSAGATAATAAPKKAVAAPALTNTIEVSRSSGVSPSLPSQPPPASSSAGQGKRISIFQRIRNGSAAAETRSAVPAVGQPAAPSASTSTSTAVTRGGAVGGQAEPQDAKAAPPATTIPTATATATAAAAAPKAGPAAGKPAAGSRGKAVERVTLAPLTTARPPATAATSKGASPVEKNTAAGSRSASPSPNTSRPPAPFPAKKPSAPAAKATAAASSAAQPLKPLEAKGEAPAVSDRTPTQGPSPPAPKVSDRRTSSRPVGRQSNPSPPIGSNPLTPASSSTAPLSQASQPARRVAEGRSPAPTAATTTTTASSSSGGMMSKSRSPAPTTSTATTTTTSGVAAAKAAGGVGAQPSVSAAKTSALASASAKQPQQLPSTPQSSADGTTAGRVAVPPTRRPVGAAVTPLPAALAKMKDSTVVRHPSPTLSVLTNVGSISANSSTHSNVSSSKLVSPSAATSTNKTATTKPTTAAAAAAAPVATPTPTTTTATATAATRPVPLRANNVATRQSLPAISKASPAVAPRTPANSMPASATAAPTEAKTTAPPLSSGVAASKASASAAATTTTTGSAVKGPATTPSGANLNPHGPNTRDNSDNAQVDDSDPDADAWLADAYDFYAFGAGDGAEEEERRDGAAGTSTAVQASAANNTAKRLSTTVASMADIDYLMF